MTEKIYVQVGNKRVEAKGEVLEQILKDRAEAAERASRIEAAEREKQEKRESAVNKLKALGLTDEEVQALIP